MSIGEAQWQEQPQESQRRQQQRQGRGWWAAFTGFIDNDLNGVSAGAAVTWMVLFRLSSNRTVVVSVERIAERTGYSSRQISRFINELVKAGLISRLSLGNRIKGATRYRIRHVNHSVDVPQS